jgi:hypothetical protein
VDGFGEQKVTWHLIWQKSYLALNLTKQYMLRNGAALATRTLIPALSRIGILAAGTPVAESAEETDMFAISTLITIF